MNFFQKFVSQFRSRLYVLFLINNVLILIDWWLSNQIFHLAGWWLVAAILVAPLITTAVIPWVSTTYLTQPTKLIWQAILYISPGAHNVPPPKVESARLGRDLVTTINNHIYQIATTAANIDVSLHTDSHNLPHNPIAVMLPLPLFVLDKQNKILFANTAAIQYIGAKSVTEIENQYVYDVLNLSFQNEETLEIWLRNAQINTVTATHTWNGVKLEIPAEKLIKYFDLSVYYNKENAGGYETLLVLFDRTSAYKQEDQTLSNMALAVHEIRTPLTLLRGYIEAFEEELGSGLSPENATLLKKMDASAQQLATFINNVLNVTRIEDNQFQVHLQEENWQTVLMTAVADMKVRASVQGISITTDIAPDLPRVGIDRVSIYEVIINLLDNAIKYSGDSKKIAVTSLLNKEGFVETSIQDFGVGIPESVMPNLFDKFYRSHRSRSKIGGTGLGLFLCRAIITAQGGNIWVRSKEGQGSVFSFTVVPYDKLTDEQKVGQTDMTHTAQVWIKNHSLYRR